MELLNNFSTREKNLWSELLVDIAVGLYYFPKMFFMLRAGDEVLTGGAMASLVISTIMVAIFAGIIVSVFLHAEEKPETVDERDHLFLARGSRVAYIILMVCVLAIMGNIVILEMLPEFVQERNWFDPTPVAIAHLLLVSLVLSSVGKTVMQLVSYRRGY